MGEFPFPSHRPAFRQPGSSAPPAAAGTTGKQVDLVADRLAASGAARPPARVLWALAGGRGEAVEQLLEDGGALLAGGLWVLGAGDVQGALVEGADEHMGQGDDRLGVIAPASIAAWSACWSRPRP